MYQSFLLWLVHFKSCLKRCLALQSGKHIIICLLPSSDLHSKFYEGQDSESCSSLDPQLETWCLTGSWQLEILEWIYAERLWKSAFLHLSKFSLVSNLHSWAEVCAYLHSLIAKTENWYPSSPFCCFLPSFLSSAQIHTFLCSITVLALKYCWCAKDLTL